jgi:hypothetical protein
VAGNVFANFKTAGGDARANGGQQIFRPRTKRAQQFFHCGSGDAGGGSSPPGVNGGDNFLPGIGNQYGDAVGRPDL